MSATQLPPLELKSTRFDWTRAYMVGVLNVTPDSFSDGGLFGDLEVACARARDMVRRGADILDVGGESTRPGSEPVTAEDEMDRVVPVIQELVGRGVGVPISIDTTKAEVASAAIDAGAEIINDISGGLFDADIVRLANEREVAYICGHVRGHDIAEVHAHESDPPSTDEVVFELCERVARLPVGLRHRTIVDPCLGFGKGGWQENATLIRASGTMARATGCPVMIGPSRKRFVRAMVAHGRASGYSGGHVSTALELDSATVGACLAALSAGAHFLRIHDVELLCPALMVYQAIMEPLS